ncbi:hypothetical protein I553_7228 [Mycobacterium xenopi 4042]|uniref:DhaL domain-containing protein n=1 Tax=Mycobacterium xenopi 4042 TaxID=1299334 RepID=X8E8S8_MYCXE|nr:hypothetical protein I553_7228 [Mycobacterium xenopi 4042]
MITHIDEINRLNVFPIADGDTGTNMLFTMRSALAEANAVANFKSGSADVAEWRRPSLLVRCMARAATQE